MKIRFAFILILLRSVSGLFASNGNVTDLDSVIKVPLETRMNYNRENINPDSVFINKVPFRSTLNVLKANFGNPDTIITKTYDCGGYFEEENVSSYYYGKTFFETFKDSAIFHVVDLREARFKVGVNKFLFDHSTTILTIKKNFPISGSESYHWVDPEDHKDYQLIRVYSKDSYNDEWIFKFLNGVLVEFEYHIQC